jgi:flagellar hook-basal body complex protein FliE
MKHVRYILLPVLVAVSCQNSNADDLSRLSKKDKQDFAELLHEPIEQMNRVIGQLNAYANQVQVINNDGTIHTEIHDIKHQSEKILAELHEIDNKLDQAFQQIAILRILVGNPDDPSVDPAQFDSVQAIDDAKLPLYVWSKTITRAIIEGNIVS